MRYAALALAVVAGLVLFRYLPLRSDPGMLLDPAGVGQLVGAALGPVAVGLLGLFYRPNRFLGFAAVTLTVTAVTMVGSIA